MKKIGYKTVELMGAACIALAVFNGAVEHYGRYVENHPYNPGEGLAIVAIALIGIVATIISQAIKNLEDKIPSKEK